MIWRKKKKTDISFQINCDSLLLFFVMWENKLTAVDLDQSIWIYHLNFIPVNVFHCYTEQ